MPRVAVPPFLSSALLAISAELFRDGTLNATTQTLCWTVVFAIAQYFGAFGSHWYGHLIGNGTEG